MSGNERDSDSESASEHEEKQQGNLHADKQPFQEIVVDIKQPGVGFSEGKLLSCFAKIDERTGEERNDP